MSTVGQSERATQNRVIELFCDELNYRKIGNRSDHANSNIDEKLLTDWLTKRGVTGPQISATLRQLHTEADNHNRSLYENNKAVYSLLRYGVPVKTDAAKPTETVHLIDWHDPDTNDFGIAEEVTLKGGHERRIDLVLYVNGLAIAVLELKNSRVSIDEAIRQNLSNQETQFNAWFFTTVQFVFAGNDSEGLQYGAIGTQEKYFLKWKEDETDNTRFKLDKYLLKMCAKARLLELIHDFVLFDGGVKKLPRVHQYFGIKEAQQHARDRKCGIIWHTQGSGKSIVMVLLAKWILENNAHARVVIITDRDELDKQIERVFGATTETEKQFIFNTYTELLKDVDAKPNMTKTETYEDRAKELFTKEPANMKLLVVVDKLLTGFDAPHCTYLYIDKSMQDHGLFQAICRTNRLDGEDKEFGYIVDYKDLFKNLVNEKGTGALQVYTSELDHSAGGADPDVLLQDRLKKGRERLDAALEHLALLCEPVEPPKGELEHIHYFCGNTEIPEDLEEREPQRAALYKGVVALVRAYAGIADELESAGYAQPDITTVRQKLDGYLKLREIIRNASGECLDLKAYEADMRHLIDTYIEADEPRRISDFGDMPLLDLLVNSGIAAMLASLPNGIKGDRRAVAETIENNVRSKIIRERLSDPAFYDSMSALLDEIIAARKQKAIDYEEYLKRIAELAKQVQAGQAENTPVQLNTPGRLALFNNLGKDETLAVRVDEAVKTSRPDGWRGVHTREQEVKGCIYGVLQDKDEVERIFHIIYQHKEY